MNLSAHDRIRFESVCKDLTAIYGAASDRIVATGLPSGTNDLVRTALYEHMYTMRRLFHDVLERGYGGDAEGPLSDLEKVEKMRDELAGTIASNRRR